MKFHEIPNLYETSKNRLQKLICDDCYILSRIKYSISLYFIGFALEERIGQEASIAGEIGREHRTIDYRSNI